MMKVYVFCTVWFLTAAAGCGGQRQTLMDLYGPCMTRNASKIHRLTEQCSKWENVGDCYKRAVVWVCER